MAEGRGKAQASSLRKTRTKTMAQKILPGGARKTVEVPTETLRKGDLVIVSAPQIIPTDVPFTAQTRMSGVDASGRRIRKGASDAIEKFVGKKCPSLVTDYIKRVSNSGGNP